MKIQHEFIFPDDNRTCVGFLSNLSCVKNYAEAARKFYGSRNTRINGSASKRQRNRKKISREEKKKRNNNVGTRKLLKKKRARSLETLIETTVWVPR